MEKLLVEKIIASAILRILEVVKPKQIILFGSAARGEMGENSDIDLLIVVPSGMHRRKTAQTIYRNMIGLGFAADIIVVTEDDLELYKDHKGMVINPALSEGRMLYAA
jgi:predicted nucleotidyltransferase